MRAESSRAEAFEAELARCHALMDEDLWDQARTELLALLENHREEDHVLVHRVQIEQDLKLCAFRSRYESPPLKSLLSGTLLSYRRSTGWIRLRYDGTHLSDFKVQSGGSPDERIFIHPIEFNGSYSIQIKSSRPPIVWVCVESYRSSYRVDFPGRRGRLSAMIGNSSSTRDTYAKSLPKTSRPSYKVKVTRAEISCYFGSKKIMRAVNEDSFFGRVAFAANDGIQEIIVEGRADPSWIQGLLDSAMKKAYATFEKHYDHRKTVPGWLLAHKEGIKPAKKGFFGRLIGAITDDSPRARLPEEAIPQWESARRLLSEGRFEEALDHCDRLRELAPDSFEARRLCSQTTQLALGRPAAIESYEQMVVDFPREASAINDLCRILLREGRAGRAVDLIAKAIRDKVWSRELEETQTLVVKTTRGPLWPRTFEHRSKNYVVYSDIDQRTCSDATTILEGAFRAFQYRLQRVPRKDRERFRVYIFSNKQGYSAYASNLGSPHPDSVGLYSPLLKQLLIYNAIDRGRMENTIRHEGFHQYLDRVVPDPPLWFNEGMAEYFELAREIRGTWTEGQVNVEHLYTLVPRRGKHRLIPLERFLYEDAETFMETPAVHYAQAWSFVHFLRQDEIVGKPIFDALFERLQRAPVWPSAVREALEGVDLDSLDQRFRAHLRTMRY